VVDGDDAAVVGIDRPELDPLQADTRTATASTAPANWWRRM
jgi:hypothetical protein